jgi:hypothetical protein
MLKLCRFRFSLFDAYIEPGMDQGGQPCSQNSNLENTLMRFLCLYKPAKPEGTPPTQEGIAKMGKLIEDAMKSGKLLATEGCLPSAKGARVRLSGGKYKVIDGPFTESKELVAGFALIQAASKDEAIEFIKEFLEVAGDGETEMRQIFEPGTDFAHK